MEKYQGQAEVSLGTFSIVVHESTRDAFEEWKVEQSDLLMDLQKESFEGKEVPEIYQACWDEGFPYTGTIGGMFSYRFTPTSLGNVITCECPINGTKFDLSESDLW